MGKRNVNYITEFDYRLYADYFPFYRYINYAAKAVDLSGGQVVTAVAAASTGKCLIYKAHAVFAKTSTTASTFSSGVSTAGFIGINLSSTTGYSGTATVTYTLGAQDRPICGA